MSNEMRYKGFGSKLESLFEWVIFLPENEEENCTFQLN